MERFTHDGAPLERWKIGSATFETCLTRGARLLRWDLHLPQGTREILYWPPQAELDVTKIGHVRGGNPILFPLMGRNYAEGEKFSWKDAEGVKRPMPQHGFARDCTFKILESSSAHAIVELVPDEKSRACYPFQYEFKVRYDFSELFLRITFSLKNCDTKPLYWCAGHHFYFTLPWHQGLGRKDYTLKIPSKKQWRHAADGKLIPFPAFKGQEEISFADENLSDCLFTQLKSATIRFGSRSGEEDIRIKIGEEPIPDRWATIVTWTPDHQAPFYCVEPWMGPPNSTEHKNGLHVVEPGQEETFLTEVSLL